MLSDCERRLLTAYVDGELSPRQKRAADELLMRSPEARALVEQLLSDAAQLRALSTPPLTIDLSAPVVEAIRRPVTLPSRPRKSSTSPTYPAWAGLALAASVLLVLGLASFGFLAQILPVERKGETLAKGSADDEELLLPEPDGFDSRGVAKAPPSDRDPPGRSRDVGQPGANPSVARKEDRPAPVDEPSVPEPMPMAPVVAAPSRDPFEIKTVQVAPPVVLRMRDLDQEAASRRLIDELRQDVAFRIELPCGNAARAFERLQTVGRGLRIGFLADSVALPRLRAAAPRSHFAIFLEDVTPAELARLFAAIGAEDRKGLAKRPPDVQFHEHLVLARMNRSDRKELADLLGIETAIPVPPRSLGPLGTDPTKSLSDLTAAQVGDSLAGQGSPRPELGKSAVPTPNQIGLVLAYGPQRSRPHSAEVKRFIEARKPPREGTLQVMLVLRAMN
jgi:hypothetical protein